MIAYLLIGVAALAMVSGIGYAVRESGKDAIRTEWAAANAAAQQKAEADRQRQDALRAAQDKEATRRLADEKNRARTLLVSLDAHIRAARLPASCRLTDGLLADVNAAIGGKGVSPGTVPSATGTTPPAR